VSSLAISAISASFASSLLRRLCSISVTVIMAQSRINKFFFAEADNFARFRVDWLIILCSSASDNRKIIFLSAHARRLNATTVEHTRAKLSPYSAEHL
jgi:hypothetical protein